MPGPGGREVGRLNLRVLPNTAEFGRSLGRYIQRIERSIKVELPVDLDSVSLRRAEAQLEELSRVRNVRVDADTALAALELDRLARPRTARVNVDVDRSAMDRVTSSLSRLGSGGGGLLSPSMPGRLALITAAVVAATPAILGLIGALAQASGIIAFLPGLVLTAAAGIGVLALAFTNLADAPRAFQRVKSAVESLKDEFIDLQRSVQAEFFADLAKPIRSLGETYLPILTAELSVMAAHANAAAQGFGRFLGNSQTISDTTEGLRFASDAFGQLAVAVEPFFAALRDISIVGASFLPGLAQGLSDAAVGFGAFIGKARESGALRQFFIDSMSAVGDLFIAVGHLGSALGGLFRATGGDAFLGKLLIVTAAIDTIFNSAQGQAGFAGLFGGLNAGLAAVFGNTQALQSLLGSLGPVAGEAFRQIGTVIGTLLSAVTPAIAILGPAVTGLITSLGGALSGMASTLGPILTTIATGLATALTAVTPVFDKLTSMFGDGVLVGLLVAVGAAIGSALVGGLVSLVAALLSPVGAIAALAAALVVAYQHSERFRGVVARVGEFITGTVVPGFMALAGMVRDNVVPVLVSLGDYFASKLVPVFQALVGFIMGTLVPGLVSIGQTVATNLFPILQTLGEQFQANILPALRSLFEVITDKVVPVLIRVGEVLVPVIKFLFDLVTTILGFVEPIFLRFAGPVLGFLIKTLATLIGWIANIIGWVIDFGGVLIAAGGKVGEFAASVRQKIADVAVFFLELPGKALAAVGNLGSTLYNAGRDLIQGLINGAASLLTKLGSFFLDKVPAFIRAPFKAALGINSPSRVFREFGVNTMEGYLLGVDDMQRRVDSRIGGIVSTPAAPTFAPAFAGGAGGLGGGIVQNIYPAPGLSEQQIGAAAARRLQMAGAR